MPARDGSGPSGSGPRTGRGMGNCSAAGSSAQNNTPVVNPNFFSWGRRLWQTFRNGFGNQGRGGRNIWRK